MLKTNKILNYGRIALAASVMILIVSAPNSAKPAVACVAPLTLGARCNLSAPASDYGSHTWMISGCEGGTLAAIIGIYKCSETEGNYGTGNPSDTPGRACWCKATGVIPSHDVASAPWVHQFNNNTNHATCVNNCARACADRAAHPAGDHFRRMLLGL